MDHLELFLDVITGVHVLEGGDLLGAVDRDQVVLEGGLDVAGGDDLLERGTVLGDAEDGRTGAVVLDLHALPDARAPEVVLGQIHDLLRRTGAFDRSVWIGEERPSRLGIADALPGVLDGVVRVVAGHPVLPESTDTAIDLVPVDLDPRSDDELMNPRRPLIVRGLCSGARGRQQCSTKERDRKLL